MAMMDYGAIVKKNGVIITDPHGGLFQNFSELKYEEPEWDEETDGFKPGNLDETVVTMVHEEGEDNKVITELRSMAGNYFALIGDEHLLIGFYKQGYTIAVDRTVDWTVKNYPQGWDWFDEYPDEGKVGHKKPCVFTYAGVKFKLRSCDPRSSYSYQKMIMSFEYKGDRYEVLFGYGVDPNPKYCYGSKSYFHRHNWFKYYREREKNKEARLTISKKIYYEERRAQRNIKRWYESGLKNNQEEIIWDKD